MNITALTRLVQTSPLLSKDERTYWMTHLSKLTPPGRAELAAALSDNTPLPFEKELKSYFADFGKAAEQVLQKNSRKVTV